MTSQLYVDRDVSIDPAACLAIRDRGAWTSRPHNTLTSPTDTCQFALTGVTSDDVQRGGALTTAQLLALLAAVGHPQRLRIIAKLAEGRVHVSELARRLGLSRPLLYLHLERLEEAGLVVGELELSGDGKAMKFYSLAPFDLHLNVTTILDAVREDQQGTAPGTAAGAPTTQEDSE